MFRHARHVARLIATALLGIFLVAFVHEARVLPGPPREPFSAMETGLIAAAVILIHFVGRWYERQLAHSLGQAPAVTSTGRGVAALRRGFKGLRLHWLPPKLRRGLGAFAGLGALTGMFLGHAGWETTEALIAGLLIGTAAGVATMLVLWLVTWPFRGLFDRLPMLWPLLVGAAGGAVVAWRFSIADQVPFEQYLVSFTIGGAVVLSVPYLLYRGGRRLFHTKRAASAPR
jgi:hypothetical protein